MWSKIFLFAANETMRISSAFTVSIFFHFHIMISGLLSATEQNISVIGELCK